MSKKTSKEEILLKLELLSKQNDITYSLIEYKGAAKSRVTYICNKCKHIGETTFYHIINGRKCKKCSIISVHNKQKKYTLQMILDKAKEYKTLKDFYTNERSMYQACHKYGWLNEINNILSKKTGLNKRCVYVIIFPNKICYVGLTYNFKQRLYQHLNIKGSVYDFIKKNKINPLESKILTDYLNQDDAQKLEQKFILHYKTNGFTLLNKCNGGSLGQIYNKITFEDCINKLSLCENNLTLFRANYKSYYDKCIRNKWFYKIIPNYKGGKPTFTYEEIVKIAKRYKTAKEFYKNNITAYRLASRKKWLNKLYRDANIITIFDNKIVQQYDLNGNFITEYKNAKVAAEENNISYKNIMNCCNCRCRQSSNNFQWKYKDSQKEIIKVTFNKYQNKEILLIDENKKTLKYYKSVKEASKLENINERAILRCCNKEYKRAFKKIFVFKDDYDNNNISFFF